MSIARLCFMVVPGAVVLFFSSLMVGAKNLAIERYVYGLPETAKCYWKWKPPISCGSGSCVNSGGSSVDTCGGPGVRRNPWGVATGQQAPAGQTAYAVDSCNGGGVTAGGSATDSGTGRLTHRKRCGSCKGKVSVTMTPSFNTCADAFDPPSNCKAYGLMEATGIPQQTHHSGPIVSSAGGAASGHPTAPTVQFAVGIGGKLTQVTLTQSASSPYSKVPVTKARSRTWKPDVSWVDLTFLGSAVLEAFADGWFVGVLSNEGAAAAHIPNRGHWNVKFVLECVGTCGRIQRLSWDKAPTPSCPNKLH